MTDTKRVAELEVGDRVIFPNCKGTSTISIIYKKSDTNYLLYTEETPGHIDVEKSIEVTYLGNNKKEEETMTAQKVDCSALYPYFDSLANEEATLKHTNVPVYVRQQLQHIHELFEDVLGLTLAEVKTLYFERKMSEQKPIKIDELESKYKKFPKTILKKVKDLQSGDKVVIPNIGDGVVTKLVEDNFGSDKSLIRVEWVCECDREVRVNLLNRERELVLLN